MRVLIQWILMILKGTVLKVSVKETPQLMNFLNSRLNEMESAKDKMYKEYDLNLIPEWSDRNIWVMMKLLNDIWFCTNSDLQDNLKFSNDVKNQNKSFYLSWNRPQSQINYKELYKEYFDRDTWDLIYIEDWQGEWLVHNNIKARGILLNELWLIFSEIFWRENINDFDSSQNLSSSYSESEVTLPYNFLGSIK